MSFYVIRQRYIVGVADILNKLINLKAWSILQRWKWLILFKWCSLDVPNNIFLSTSLCLTSTVFGIHFSNLVLILLSNSLGVFKNGILQKTKSFFFRIFGLTSISNEFTLSVLSTVLQGSEACLFWQAAPWSLAAEGHFQKGNSKRLPAVALRWFNIPWMWSKDSHQIEIKYVHLGLSAILKMLQHSFLCLHFSNMLAHYDN